MPMTFTTDRLIEGDRFIQGRLIQDGLTVAPSIKGLPCVFVDKKGNKF